jgi:hypothetical protein
MLKFSFRTFTTGAKQFVVHEAFEMILCSSVILSSLHPKTTVKSGFDAGALINTRLAPAVKCLDAPSLSVNLPVDSTATSILF